MATAAGLISPGLVSLVKRAQRVREEMDQSKSEKINITNNRYDVSTFPRRNGKKTQRLRDSYFGLFRMKHFPKNSACKLYKCKVEQDFSEIEN